MGIKLIDKEWCAGTDECICEFICDTDADFDNLPKVNTGSSALSIESGSVRMVNTSGEWIPFAE